MRRRTRLIRGAASVLLVLIACEPGGSARVTPPSAEAVLRSFTSSLVRGNAAIERTAIGPDVPRLQVAARALTEGGVVGITAWGPSVSRPGRVSATLEMRFDDGGTLTTRAEAVVRAGRVVAHPSVISLKLQAWEPLVVEKIGAPRAGDILSRSGTLLASGPAGTRSISSPHLTTGVDLVDASHRAILSGAYGRRLLAGRPPRLLAESPPADGRDLMTSIDDGLQGAAAETLKERPGALVALDPKTGGIRAFVANEDPLKPGISTAAEPHSPGSTFKIVTAAAALESGRFRPEDMLPCPAQLVVGGQVIANFRGANPGPLTLHRAFALSCNTAFASLGSRLGFSKIREMAERLGVLAPSAGVGPGELVVPRSREEQALLGFGALGVALTPVALAGSVATIGTGGHLVTPGWTEGEPGARVLKTRTATQMVRLMEGVVREGTGRRAAIEGTPLAGKTGTAEVRQGAAVRNDAWFVALAPSRTPHLVVVAYLPGGGVGGETAAPLVRAFLLASQETLWHNPGPVSTAAMGETPHRIAR